LPRYYFDVDGLPPALDATGEDFRGDEQAWYEATQFAGQLFKDVDGNYGPAKNGDWLSPMLIETSSTPFTSNRRNRSSRP
jgi:hypothetical protein